MDEIVEALRRDDDPQSITRTLSTIKATLHRIKPVSALSKIIQHLILIPKHDLRLPTLLAACGALDASNTKISNASDIISFLITSVEIPDNVELLQLLALNDPTKNPGIIATDSFLLRFVPILPDYPSLVTLLDFLLPSVPRRFYIKIIPSLLKSISAHCDSNSVQISGMRILARTIAKETSHLAIINGIVPRICSILSDNNVGDDERFDDALTILFSLDVSHLRKSDKSAISSVLMNLNASSSMHVSSQRIRLNGLLRIYSCIGEEEEEEEEKEEKKEEGMDMMKVAKFAVRLKRRATVAMADALLRDDSLLEDFEVNDTIEPLPSATTTPDQVKMLFSTKQDNVLEQSNNNYNTQLQKLREKIKELQNSETQLQNRLILEQHELKKEKKRSARILSKFRGVRNAYRNMKTKLQEEAERNKRVVANLQRRLNEKKTLSSSRHDDNGKLKGIITSSTLYDAMSQRETLSHANLEQFFATFSYTYPFTSSATIPPRTKMQQIDLQTFKHILDGTLRSNNVDYATFLHEHAIPHLLNVTDSSAVSSSSLNNKNHSKIIKRNVFATKRFSSRLKSAFKFYVSESYYENSSTSKKKRDAISQDQCRRFFRDFRISPGLLSRRQVNMMLFSDHGSVSSSDNVAATIKYSSVILMLKAIAKEAFPKEQEGKQNEALVGWMEKSRGFEKVKLLMNIIN